MEITRTLERAETALPPDTNVEGLIDESGHLTLTESVRLQLDGILEQGHPAAHEAVHAVSATILKEKGRFITHDPETNTINMSPDQLRGLLAAASIGGAAVVVAWVGDSLAGAHELEERHLTPLPTTDE